MVRPWTDIEIFYRDLIDRGMRLHGMLHLVEEIEASRYAAAVFGETSIYDLCVSQMASGVLSDGPHLRISPRLDGTVEFRYIDTHVKAKQWHRVVKDEDAFGRLVGFFDQLRWFAGAIR